MSVAVVTKRASATQAPDRRLIAAIVASLLLHGTVLLLQFGIPGIGLPGPSAPLTVRIGERAPVPPVPPAPPAPLAAPAVPAVPVPAPPVVRAIPAAPAPALPEPAAPVVQQAKPAIKKGAPRRTRRISPPLTAREVHVLTERLITQNSTLNDFAMPLVRPEEAEQKSVDLMEAQHGSDDGRDVSIAAEEALQEAMARAAKAERLQQQADAAEALALRAQQRQRQRRLEREQTERDLARQAALERQLRADELARKPRDMSEQLAEQGQAALEQLTAQVAEQERAALQLAAAQQRAEQLAEQQRAEQLAERQRADQLAEQQRAEQLAEQLAEQQRAEQLAELEAARQLAEQQAAQRSAAAAAAAAPSAAAGPGAAQSGSLKLPKDVLGSALSQRARELVKGLDVLSGAPPAAHARDARRIVMGPNERDLPLRMYVESWRQKIERNGMLNYPRSWSDLVRIDPLVSVAVRSDGSVESVVVIRSSGRSDMDQAVLRIVSQNARYSRFPPDIAQRYDVIEIRRVWKFDEALKLLEELR